MMPRTATRAPASWLDDAPVVAFLLCALVLGVRTDWGIGDAVLAMLAVGMLARAGWRQIAGLDPRWKLLDWTALIAFVLVAAWQLLPWPAPAWAALPGRAPLVRAVAEAGVSPRSHYFPLDPGAAWRGLLATLPALAMFLCARTASQRLALRLCVALVAFACASALLGVLQAVTGAASPLRLHAQHNPAGALGLFAYRNLHAALLLMAIPVACALASLWSPFSRDDRPARFRLSIAACLLLLAGAGLTYSRAALGLGTLALAACLLLLVPMRRPGAWRRAIWLPALLLPVLGATAWLGWPVLSERLGESLSEDGRWALYRAVIAAGQPYQPVGAGLGGFEDAFQSSPFNAALINAYMNQAHNEWLALWFELGWPGVALMGLGVIVIARAVLRNWRDPQAERRLIERAALISLVTVGLHACVDLPLRSGATFTVFALLFGLVTRPNRGRRQAHVPASAEIAATESGVATALAPRSRARGY